MRKLRRNKRGSANILWLGLAGIGIIAIVGLVLQLVGIANFTMTTPLPTEDGVVVEETITKSWTPVGSVDVGHHSIPLASAAQDDDDDVHACVFAYDSDGNSDLTASGIVDCSGITPVEWDGTEKIVAVPESARCKLNYYWWWQTATAGSEYLSFNTEWEEKAHGLGDQDSDDGATKTVHLPTGDTTYVMCVGDSSEDNDMEPVCFLFKLSELSLFDSDNLVDGTIDIIFEHKYYSDAVGHSKTQLSGECYEAGTNNHRATLSSSLDGALSTDLATASTNHRLKCDVELEVTEDGYKVFLDNPLWTDDYQRSYLQVEVYGEEDANQTQGTWQEMVSTTSMYDVSRAATVEDCIIWSSSSICGKTLTGDTSTANGNVLVNANEKIYSPDCLVDAADDGGKITLPISIVNIASVDYDLATAGNDTILSANSGSSPEAIMDINLITLVSSTDAVDQTLNA